MKTISKLNLEIGMVNIPVRVMSFADYSGITFKNVCPYCQSNIQYKRVCPRCNKEIPYDKIEKAFQVSKDKKIIVDKQLIKQLQENTETELLKIVNDIEDEGFELMTEKHYLLMPNKDIPKQYFFLRDLLKTTKKRLLIRYVIRNKEHLGLVKPYNRVLILKQMIYPEQIRKPEEMNEIKIEEKTLELGKELLKNISNTTKELKINQIQNNYKKKLLEYILENKPLKIKHKEDKENDLDKLLEKSIKKKKIKVEE